MRTTLDIGGDVLAVAGEKTRREGVSLGRAVPAYVLRGIHSGGPNSGSRRVPISTPPQESQAHTVALDHVERYRDSDE